MARTQKNKATEYHLGQLKAKLAKLRSQLLEGPTAGGGGGKGDGFDVGRYGDARVALIGFPSVGKSTLLTSMTGVNSEVGAYDFTTLTCVPGVYTFNDTKVQLLDLPGIIEGAADGRGRGRQVISTAKSSDVILMVLDATKDDVQRRLLEKELHSVGIRLNREPPRLSIQKKKTGGVTVGSNCTLTKLNDKMICTLLKEYKIHNADVTIFEDCSVDDFIDGIEGNRKYVKCIYAYNKIDMLTAKQVDALARRDNHVVISSSLNWNIDTLKQRLWDNLELVRVYTKKRGQYPDFDDPIILTPQRGGSSVENAVRHVHKDLLKDFKSGFVWGTSVRYIPMQVGLNHVLADEDVLQVMKK
ncbi:MAG: hypothetical protein KVP17_002196 [Porospora cf. gigantea B]|uniref:uncharacterized protein n=1 Tax=Porospora cf. gigantea B TaxID=2853592 RepID=UPI003571D1D0|nr:MAG: hypothetical protein KVP17_002196 [Porospora cf. gigantea B]